ncbi:MAG: hypothetical protein HC934_00575 [Acaryochloridaceae cyanobacterium SU_2_1]|nr:hypothetical protein [Acaryochloridaceae cyanobacterium SU_2_1]
MLQCPRLLLPQMALVEVAHLLGRDAGTQTIGAFLQGLSVSRLVLLEALDKVR